MTKCVAYCRVSKDREDQLNSLRNQIGHYTSLFEKDGFQGAECGVYYGKERRTETLIPLKSIFADEGISGTKLKNREAFKRMLEHAFRKEFDVIYIKNIQRFARNVEDGAGILKKLKVIGVKVVFEDGNLNNFDNEMAINVLLSTSQEESRAKGRAVQFGLHHSQKEGKWTAAAPYGYYKESAMLRPISEQIDVVREIFRQYHSGLGGNSISKWLNANGFLTQKGRPWYPSLIYNIIQNPIYIGKHITNRSVNTDVNLDSVVCNGKRYLSQKETDESEWIVTQREDLRAVDDATYYAVQDEYRKRMELNDRKGRPSTKHLFSNLLYCHSCNMAMRRKKRWGWTRQDGSRKMDVEWVCTTHDMQHDKGCPFRNSRHESDLIEKACQEIKRILADRKILQVQFEEYVRLFITDEQVSERINAIRAELNEINGVCSTNLLLLTRKIIDEEQYRAQNITLQAKKREMESNLHRYESLGIAQANARKKHEEFMKYLNAVNLNNLENITLKKLFSRIEAYTVTDDDGNEVKGLHFVWNLVDKSEDDILLGMALNSDDFNKHGL